MAAALAFWWLGSLIEEDYWSGALVELGGVFASIAAAVVLYDRWRARQWDPLERIVVERAATSLAMLVWQLWWQSPVGEYRSYGAVVQQFAGPPTKERHTVVKKKIADLRAWLEQYSTPGTDADRETLERHWAEEIEFSGVVASLFTNDLHQLGPALQSLHEAFGSTAPVSEPLIRVAERIHRLVGTGFLCAHFAIGIGAQEMGETGFRENLESLLRQIEELYELLVGIHSARGHRGPKV